MIEVHTFSEAGGHEVNEDAFGAQLHPQNQGYWICCLADGQGGQAGGRAAAQLASRKVMELATAEDPAMLLYAKTWLRFLEHADQTVMTDQEAGFTTLIGFCVTESRLIGASVGNSEVLVATRGRLQPLEATMTQRKNPPVGSGSARFAPFTMTLVPPWTVLAVSDGVWKFSGKDFLLESIGKIVGVRLIESLKQRARLPRSGRFQDDFTIIALEKLTN